MIASETPGHLSEHADRRDIGRMRFQVRPQQRLRLRDVVTAQRRSQSVQKVPATVQALTGATLEKLNITSLDQILKLTPTVTASFNGPGQGSIFMSRDLPSGAICGSLTRVILLTQARSKTLPGVVGMGTRGVAGVCAGARYWPGFYQPGCAAGGGAGGAAACGV